MNLNNISCQESIAKQLESEAQDVKGQYFQDAVSADTDVEGAKSAKEATDSLLEKATQNLRASNEEVVKSEARHSKAAAAFEAAQHFYLEAEQNSNKAQEKLADEQQLAKLVNERGEAMVSDAEAELHRSQERKSQLLQKLQTLKQTHTATAASLADCTEGNCDDARRAKEEAQKVPSCSLAWD